MVEVAPAFRRALPADAAALAGFMARTFREAYEGTCDARDIEAYIVEHFGPELQSKEIADARLDTLLVFMGDDLAGYAQLREGPAPASVVAGRPYEIKRFYVDHSWQGRGLAGSLMGAALAAAPAGTDRVWLQVMVSNGRAIRFYEKCGFRIVGETTFMMGADEQRDYVMVWSAEGGSSNSD